MKYRLLFTYRYNNGLPGRYHTHDYSDPRFARFAACMKLKQFAEDMNFGRISEARVRIMEVEDEEDR